eukprot:1230456-Pyramimonas_sp.AAC.1
MIFQPYLDPIWALFSHLFEGEEGVLEPPAEAVAGGKQQHVVLHDQAPHQKHQPGVRPHPRQGTPRVPEQLLRVAEA